MLKSMTENRIQSSTPGRRFVSFRFVSFDAGRPLVSGTSFWGFRTNVPTQWISLKNQFDVGELWAQGLRGGAGGTVVFLGKRRVISFVILGFYQVFNK